MKREREGGGHRNGKMNEEQGEEGIIKKIGREKDGAVRVIEEGGPEIEGLKDGRSEREMETDGLQRVVNE